jgi:uncharacterized Tic20 family protein
MSENTSEQLPDQEQGMNRESRNWAMWIHLSQFAAILVPLAGYVLPIVLWQIKKDELSGVDAHGRIVTNWIISSTIYIIIALILSLFCIGIFLLILLAVIVIIYPVVGGIKANEGKLWNYPGAIPFFSIKQ